MTKTPEKRARWVGVVVVVAMFAAAACNSGDETAASVWPFVDRRDSSSADTRRADDTGDRLRDTTDSPDADTFADTRFDGSSPDAIDTDAGDDTGPPVADADTGTDGDSQEGDTSEADADAGPSCGNRASPWRQQYGSSRRDEGHGLAVDGCRAVYTVGVTYGESFEGTSTERFGDAFVVRHALDGSRRWVRTLGSAAYDSAVDVAVGPNGAIYVAGETTGPLAGGNYKADLDGFVAKYSPSGKRRWVRLFGTVKRDRPRAVVADGGRVYVVGRTDGPLGGETYSGGAADAFVTAFDTAGTRLWDRLLGSGWMETFRDVEVGPGGDLFAAGVTTGDLDGTQAQTPKGLLARYGAGGNRRWITVRGAPVETEYHGVDVGPSGRVLVGGHATGALGGQTYSGGDTDGLVARYDSGGSRAWVRLTGTEEPDFVESVAVTATGQIHVAGSTASAFGGQTYAGGTFDGFIEEWSMSGASRGVTMFGTRGEDTVRDVAVDGRGAPYVVGVTDRRLGGSHLGSTDAFLLR